jgi:SAM-dependent methyltransferase
MFSETAELYDLIYGQFKDYVGESRRIAALLEGVHPGARRLLDVACGTGEHARVLAAEHGYAVDGLDLEPELVRIARSKNPGGQFFCADMVDFQLERRYDAVLCLFSSIGYVKTLENVRRTLESFRRLLAPGGVVIVEPWFEPGQWRAGGVFVKTAEAEGIHVCRMSHSTVRDGASVLEFQYLIGRAGRIEHRREVHELGLFTAQEMQRCFAEAGLAVVEHDPEGLTGRGLFVARAATETKE